MKRLSVLMWLTWLMCGGAQAGFLLSVDEAEKREQLACVPSVVLGVLECENLPAPPVVRKNDPSIKPAEYVANTGTAIPEQQVELPMLPALDPLPSRIKAGRFVLAWDIWFGSAGQWWEVWDNDELRYRGSDFSRRLKAAPPNTPAEQLVLTSGTPSMQAVQSGVYSVKNLELGEHRWRVRLCNGTIEAPVCNEVSAATWAEAGASDEQAETIQKPEKPQLAWIPQVTTEGTVPLKWNIWWGVVGTHWEVINQGKVIYRSAKFGESAENSQAGWVDVPLANGAHLLSVRVCRQLLCSESDKVQVDAMLGPDLAPAEPQVQLFSSEDPDLGDGLADGQVLLSWKTEQTGAAPDQWLLVDAASKRTLFKQKLSKDCGAGVWCGSWQGVPASRPAVWTVKLCRAKMCSSSAIVEIAAEASFAQ